MGHNASNRRLPSADRPYSTRSLAEIDDRHRIFPPGVKLQESGFAAAGDERDVGAVLMGRRDSAKDAAAAVREGLHDRPIDKDVHAQGPLAGQVQGIMDGTFAVLPAQCCATPVQRQATFAGVEEHHGFLLAIRRGQHRKSDLVRAAQVDLGEDLQCVARKAVRAERLIV